jgi:heme exporter protein A
MTLFAGDALACERGERLVFAGLSFALAAGDALLVTGANGSGKSSLLRLAAGLLRPAAGALRWHGAAIAADPEAHRARICYVGHQDPVKPLLSLGENLCFWARLRGAPESAADAALERFGLAPLAALPARLLSAGQKRRLNLARLLLGPAPLWLLDEPSLGLDRDAVAALEAALADQRAGGGIVLLATHLPLALPGAVGLDLAGFAAASESAQVPA